MHLNSWDSHFCKLRNYLTEVFIISWYWKGNCDMLRFIIARCQLCQLILTYQQGEFFKKKNCSFVFLTGIFIAFDIIRMLRYIKKCWLLWLIPTHLVESLTNGILSFIKHFCTKDHRQMSFDFLRYATPFTKVIDSKCIHSYDGMFK